MNAILKEKADNMLDMVLALEKSYKWEHNLARHFTALLYTRRGLPKDFHRIDEATSAIKSTTGVFSNYRGTIKFILATLLALEEGDVASNLEKIKEAEVVLKESGFKSSIYLPMTSYTLFSGSDAFEYRSVSERANTIYKEMKKAHPFLTDGADYPLSVLIAQKQKRTDTIEQIYESLSQRGFTKGNELQLLSHILSLSTLGTSQLIEKCVELNTTLKANKLKSSMGYYPSIAMIALLEEGSHKLTEDFMELTKYLMKLKKFKWLGKGMNMLFASALVADQWIEEHSDENVTDMETVLGLTIESVIIAQTVAMIAAISAATAASSSNVS
ncbi:MAG: DUF4003 domain-containing protein [Clostridiales bacterium]|nr:DUF4003 domain-containing protein [Clostridiales bacterium]